MLLRLFLSTLLAIFVYPLSAEEPITPIQPPVSLSEAKVRLGELLFHDVRLSRDNSISCAQCHNLATNGSDSLPSSIGIAGQKGEVKSPTVYNSTLNFMQFWDGRARTLEQQAGMPIHNPIEMDSNWQEVIGKLNADRAFSNQFSKTYPDGFTPENISDALVSFERSLMTVNSPFDRWLQGDKAALSEDAEQGYALFKGYGCISCHQGQNVGGNMFAYMGSVVDYFGQLDRQLRPSDMGRFNVTGRESDKFLFKVPSLRLAALQKYFFHDASADSLPQAVRVMAKHQLGRDVSEQDVTKIVAFLESLVGYHPRLKAE